MSSLFFPFAIMENRPNLDWGHFSFNANWIGGKKESSKKKTADEWKWLIIKYVQQRTPKLCKAKKLNKVKIQTANQNESNCIQTTIQMMLQ